MAHELKSRPQWGTLLGQTIILAVCGVWLVFSFMAVTHTLPVAFDYLERFRLRLSVGNEGLVAIFQEPLVLIGAVLVVLFLGVLALAVGYAVFLAKPPAPVDPEHYPGAIGPLPRAIRRPLDPVGGAFAHPQRHRGD
jgi:hypothetical protein